MSKIKFWDLKIKNSVKPADTPVEPVENQISDKVEAELFLYGDVVDTVPTDFWTGEKIDGDFIAQDDFVKDIRSLKEQGVTDLTVHINSCGGNLYTGSAIHDLLKEMVKNVTVIVEGIAASAATVIAVAGDTVKMAKNALFMIHEPSVTVWDNFTADDAEKLKNMLDAGAESAALAYAEKTGMSVKALRKMMKEETWMTGEEALEKGFVDELVDGDVVMAMSTDGLIVNGDTVTIKDYTNLPESIAGLLNEADEPAEPTEPAEPDDGAAVEDIEPAEPAEPVEDADPAEPVEDDGAAVEDPTDDIQIEELTATAEGLEEKFPEIINQIRNQAIEAERERIRQIDAIATRCDAEMVMKAKYETPITAEKLAYENVLAGKDRASSFLADNARDVQASNTSEVEVTPTMAEPEPEDERKRLAMKIAGVQNTTKEGGTKS